MSKMIEWIKETLEKMDRTNIPEGLMEASRRRIQTMFESREERLRFWVRRPIERRAITGIPNQSEFCALRLEGKQVLTKSVKLHIVRVIIVEKPTEEKQ